MAKSKSFRLFLISITIIGLTLLTATFWSALGLGPNKIPLAVSMMVSFGISISGLIFGLMEIKQYKTRKIIIGFIGNILVILFFIFMIIYSLNT